MPKRSGILGMDIGGTRFRIGFVDQDGILSHYREERTQEFFKAGEDIFSVFAELFQTYKREFSEEIEILALSVAFPFLLTEMSITSCFTIWSNWASRRRAVFPQFTSEPVWAMPFS